MKSERDRERVLNVFGRIKIHSLSNISHHGIVLNLIFARFCRIQKTVYPIQKFICVKTYLGQGEYYQRISAKLVKKHPKIRVFPDFRKIRIRNFFGLKPSRDQDGANKKKFSQIGPAVPEEIGHKHKQAHKHRVAI